jgi:tetrapyrrole methylase family protein/MazG family protein
MGSIRIVGLGPGDAGDITRRVWAAIEQASVVFVRTAQHPCVPLLPHADVRPFDALYDAHTAFDDVYAAITGAVLTAAAHGDVIYAVPGDPLVGEATTRRLLEGARAAGIPIQVYSGISFIEPALALLNRHGVVVDGMEGIQVLDALDLAVMHHPPINPDAPALIGQVYSRQVASDLKLTLMNQYPDDFIVYLLHEAGSDGAILHPTPLHAIDHDVRIRHLTALFVPALGGMSSFERFQETIAHLRAPEGCPWDRKQTHESLRRYLIEEAYEVLDAIDAGDAAALAEELGDVLLQVVLHAQIAVDDGEFRMADVIRIVNDKMIRRHPHVWGETAVSGADQVVANWEAIKRAEKDTSGGQPASLLDGVPKGLPALMQAHDYTARAAKVGFDWPHVQDVLAKVSEELDEIADAARQGDAEHVREEFGDLLFVLVNWARWQRIDAEQALRDANAKFARRFRAIETQAAAQGRALTDMTLDEMDALWNAAKAAERASGQDAARA